MMQSRSTGFAASCLLWVILFGVLVSCLCPSITFVGVFASTFGAESIAGIVDDYLCPEGSTGEIITYQVIPRRNAIDYEMQCVSAGGEVVRDPSPDYAFYWLGALAVITLVAAGFLSLILLVPVAAIIARRQDKRSARQPFREPY